MFSPRHSKQKKDLAAANIACVWAKALYLNTLQRQERTADSNICFAPGWEEIILHTNRWQRYIFCHSKTETRRPRIVNIQTLIMIKQCLPTFLNSCQPIGGLVYQGLCTRQHIVFYYLILHFVLAKCLSKFKLFIHFIHQCSGLIAINDQTPVFDTVLLPVWTWLTYSPKCFSINVICTAQRTSKLSWKARETQKNDTLASFVWTTVCVWSP